MDLAKFVWLLKRRRLYLPRVELLRDPHEGSLPRLNYEATVNFWTSEGRPEIAHLMSRSNRGLREATYVSCWTMSVNESEAMWRLYCGEEQGIAIQTTYRKLAHAINQDPMFIGVVKYIDFDSVAIPSGNIFYPFMHKRLAFSHECEVRIIKLLGDQVTQYMNDTPYKKNPPLGVELDFDVETLVDQVYIHPYSQGWFEQSVRAVIEILAPALATKVSWSRMKSAPLY